MKITNRYNTCSKAQYIAGLRSRGYRRIGQGAYAQVFAKPKGTTVVKVGSQDPYLTYVREIDAKNPMCPRIISAWQMSPKHGNADDFYVVEMERLKPLDKNGNWEKLLPEYGCTWIHELSSCKARPPTTAKMRFAAKMAKLLKKISKAGYMDLHDGNVMLRKETKGYMMVVTDPLC